MLVGRTQDLELKDLHSNPAPPRSHVTLGELPNLADLLFPHWYKGDNNSTSQDFCGD